MEALTPSSPQRSPVWLLGPGQVLSWGTLYYGITFLAAPIHEATGWSLGEIFGAYSAGLLVSALAAPLAGQLLHRLGGRLGLSLGSLLAALSLAAVAVATDPLTFLLGWLLAGAAMALTLYEAAFTALREFCGDDFRRAMTLLTLVGGFASTVFWPLSYWLIGHLDWRQTLLVFAALHALVCLPLHLLLPRLADAAVPVHTEQPPPSPAMAGLFRLPAYWGLVVAIASTALLAGGVSAHAGLLLAAQGVSPPLLLLTVSLIGPMQVAGRMVDLAAARRLPVRWSGYLSHLLLPVAVGLLLLVPYSPYWVFVFAALYGAANGILTIVRGMAPTELLGHVAYGPALGWVAAPGLIARAVAPAITAFAIERWGNTAALLWLAGVGLIGVAAFVVAYRSGPSRVPSSTSDTVSA